MRICARHEPRLGGTQFGNLVLLHQVSASPARRTDTLTHTPDTTAALVWGISLEKQERQKKKKMDPVPVPAARVLPPDTTVD